MDLWRVGLLHPRSAALRAWRAFVSALALYWVIITPCVPHGGGAAGGGGARRDSRGPRLPPHALAPAKTRPPV